MTPIKCTGCGKYYDADKYDVCPHCNADSGNVQLPPRYYDDNATGARASSPEKSRKKGLFSGRKHSEKRPVSLTGGAHAQENGGAGKSDPQPDSRGGHPAAGREQNAKAPIAVPAQYAAKPSVPQPQYAPQPQQYAQPQQPQQQPQYTPPQPSAQQAPPLGEAIRSATAAQDDSKTVGIYNIPNTSGAPVVGWLVCVKGESVGESFNIRSGRNNIGRAVSMDISLVKEKSVSRERHCSITFEPKQKKFFLQSGESSGLTYVNDELVMTYVTLNNHDKILLGNSMFVFIRLVDEHFTWDDYIDA